jgi:hypothetical protein
LVSQPPWRKALREGRSGSSGKKKTLQTCKIAPATVLWRLGVR